jgi:uncharacterized protein (TIGR02270 family)
MIIADIVSHHAEEAAFLWLLRSNATRAPHYGLKDLAKLDERVEAHLDGLRVAGEPGWELCKAALGNEEAGEVFAASVMAFESGIGRKEGQATFPLKQQSGLDWRRICSHGVVLWW